MNVFLKRAARKLGGMLFSDLNLRRIRASRAFRELIEREPDKVNILKSEYAGLIRGQSPAGILRTRERKIYSQNGEDGLLLHFFSVIGAPNKTFIEFGIEDGTECNGANLAINFGWKGLFIEGSPNQADLAKAFYHDRHKLSPSDVRIECKFLNTENINEVFSACGFSGDLDLLSIDIDGVDYWIWKAIEVVLPRIVIVEYNASFGAARSITVPYHPSFDRYEKHPSGWYHGASLTALTRLAAAKKYILAGCDSCGCNAIFIRADLAASKVEPINPQDAFYPCAARLREASLEGQFDQVKHLEFVEI